ncbi:unnamed protein product [Arabidopsis halleri]
MWFEAPLISCLNQKATLIETSIHFKRLYGYEEESSH